VMNATGRFLDAALYYAAHGWSVLPLEPGAKTPLTPRGCKDASRDPAQLASWWTDEYPDANIGVATGDISGITVLDVDNKPGRDGYASFETLRIADIQTPWQVTGSGGKHIFFSYAPGIRNTVDKLGPGLDTRGAGGYVVVAPSVVDDRAYSWIVPPFNGTPFASVPEQILDRLEPTQPTGTRRSTAEWLEMLGGVDEGRRQDTLVKVVGKLYHEVPELARELAHAWNEGRCNPPLDAEAVDACCDRIEAKEMAKASAANDAGGERYTDMANAERLAAEAAGRVAHVDEMKDRFYVYDGKRLKLEPRTAVVPLVKSVARRLYAEGKEAADEAIKQRAALAASNGNLSHQAETTEKAEIDRLTKLAKMRRDGATRLENRDGAYAAIELLKAEPAIRVSLDVIDAHPLWLNTPSGTLDLETGEVHEHRFSDYVTRVTGAAYDPTATCPRWEAFLEEVVPDIEVRLFLQRSVGYALTDLTKEQCLWFLYGLGRNGKTTFINAVRSVLGDYAAATKASTLMLKAHGDDKRNDIAVLRGARFVSATEAEDGQQLAEALIKEVTGGDPVTARLMYAEFFTFRPTFKIWLAANHKPVIRGTDLGIWRRIHLVPFEVTVAEDKVDRELPDALAAEASGILNWAINGYRQWQTVGLLPPKAVEAATAAYREESDPLRDFFDECTIKGATQTAVASELFASYQAWAVANGIKKPLTKQMLGRELTARGFRSERGTRDGDRRTSWRGLSVRT